MLEKVVVISSLNIQQRAMADCYPNYLSLVYNYDMLYFVRLTDANVSILFNK